MNRRKELQEFYKEIKTQAGLYQIKNAKNQKLFIESTPNLKSINGKKMALNMGNHMNKLLQSEWKEYGEAAFEVEVLEVLKEKKDVYFNVKEELKKMEQKWLDKLQPYGEHGYHQEKMQ